MTIPEAAIFPVINHNRLCKMATLLANVLDLAVLLHAYRGSVPPSNRVNPPPRCSRYDVEPPCCYSDQDGKPYHTSYGPERPPRLVKDPTAPASMNYFAFVPTDAELMDVYGEDLDLEMNMKEELKEQGRRGGSRNQHGGCLSPTSPRRAHRQCFIP